MNWPLAADFCKMLQNPGIAFRDPALQQCAMLPIRPGSKEPKPWAGNFAVVFQGLRPNQGGPLAVRVFTTASPQRRERYEQVSAYLKQHRPKCIIDFRYSEQGIRSTDGKWYPLITMEWVEGETLFHWVRNRCLGGDRDALLLAADHFLYLTEELEAAGLAHGDLQHGNIMVNTVGELKLVDYDCMCVPELVGQRNMEVGMEPYQHPARDGETSLSPQLDRFSTLVIYTTLRALAVEPGLWHKYVEQSDYDKLLFRADDFRDPEHSPLIRELSQLGDEDVRYLTAVMLKLYHGPMDEIPPLSGLFHALFVHKLSRLLRAENWQTTLGLLTRRSLFDPQLKALFDVSDWPGVVQRFDGLRRRDHVPPEWLQAELSADALAELVQQGAMAARCQEAWSRVSRTFEALPQPFSEELDRTLIAAWNDKLFARYKPARKYRQYVAASADRLRILARIHRLHRESKAAGITRQSEREIADAAKLPKGYVCGLQVRVETARQRTEAFDQWDRAIGGGSEAAIVQVWEIVQRLGMESAVGEFEHQRVELAWQRMPAIEQLKTIDEGMPLPELDQWILTAWQGAEALLEGCQEADPWREKYKTARHRTGVLARLAAAVERRDDEVIAAEGKDPCLENYPLPKETRAALSETEGRRRRAEALLEVLEGSAQRTPDRDMNALRSSFHEGFDAEVISRYARLFEPHWARLLQLTEAEVLPARRVGLREAVARDSLFAQDPADGVYRARWIWPNHRFSNHCVLAVLPAEPSFGDDPRQLDVARRQPVTREKYEEAGGMQLIRGESTWSGYYVAVWAVISLGDEVLHSEPLILGQLGDLSGVGKKKRKSLRKPKKAGPEKARREKPRREKSRRKKSRRSSQDLPQRLEIPGIETREETG